MTVRPFLATVPPCHEGSHLVVVGDTQRTSLLEAWREKNDAERASILREIGAERPDLVAFTGDLVFDGAADGHWREFDELARPIHDLPVVVAFGNHEYWEGRQPAERQVFARFPLAMGRHWYTVAFGPVRLVVVDSNEDELRDDEKAAQRGFYDRALEDADADPTVRGVLVLMHHPPYTNSTVTGDEAHVQRDFVPSFLRAKKTIGFLTGHVHSYERFARGGKMFVVSGGGGGPRAELAMGAARRHPDDLFDGPSLRDFHFTVYTVRAGALDAEVRAVPKGGAVFRTMDRFTLPFPAP
jgi:predicted phosphohydrolase